MSSGLKNFMVAGLLLLPAAFVNAKTAGRKPASESDTTVTIMKTKKGKAIIQYDEKFDPKAGEIYVLTKRGNATDMGSLEEGRRHLLELSLNLGFLSSKVDGGDSVSSNSIDTSIKYGWNKADYEFGPLLSYDFVRYQDTDSKTILLGGFFDWNFQPNVTEADSVIALRLTVALGQNDNSAQSSAASVNQATAGVVYKWFGLSPNVAFDLDLSYLMKNTTLDSVKTQTSGFVAVLGLLTYF